MQYLAATQSLSTQKTSGTMANEPTVLVTVRFFDEHAIRLLNEHGFRVSRGGVEYDGIDSTITHAMHADLRVATAWIMGIPPISEALLQKYPNLKILARRGVGYDTIDVSGVRNQGRVLTITPGCNEPAVADHAVGLMLALGKGFMASHLRMKSGNSSIKVGVELVNKTVGLVGFGRIARLVAKRLSGFDVRVLAYDPGVDEKTIRSLGVEPATLDSVLIQSDYVSLHAPLNESTRHVISREALTRMKTGAMIINTARGELIDDAALLEALETGKISGAGLDVLSSESDPSMKDITQRLLQHPNVLCTQHTGGSSHESLARANMLAAQCVIQYFRNATLPTDCVVVDGRQQASH